MELEEELERVMSEAAVELELLELRLFRATKFTLFFVRSRVMMTNELE
jgi:hypothetical protein